MAGSSGGLSKPFWELGRPAYPEAPEVPVVKAAGSRKDSSRLLGRGPWRGPFKGLAPCGPLNDGLRAKDADEWVARGPMRSREKRSIASLPAYPGEVLSEQWELAKQTSWAAVTPIFIPGVTPVQVPLPPVPDSTIGGEGHGIKVMEIITKTGKYIAKPYEKAMVHNLKVWTETAKRHYNKPGGLHDITGVWILMPISVLDYARETARYGTNLPPFDVWFQDYKKRGYTHDPDYG